MTSILAKVALAAVLTLASALGLFGLSGFIIFADLSVPEPAAVVDNPTANSSRPLAITGPNS